MPDAQLGPADLSVYIVDIGYCLCAGTAAQQESERIRCTLDEEAQSYATSCELTLSA